MKRLRTYASPRRCLAWTPRVCQRRLGISPTKPRPSSSENFLFVNPQSPEKRRKAFVLLVFKAAKGNNSGHQEQACRQSASARCRNMSEPSKEARTNRNAEENAERVVTVDFNTFTKQLIQSASTSKTLLRRIWASGMSCNAPCCINWHNQCFNPSLLLSVMGISADHDASYKRIWATWP